MLRPALVIAARILRQRLRDRTAIIFAILTPLGLAVAFSALIPNEFSSFTTRFVVVDHDRGHVARVLVDDVLGQVAKSGVATIDEIDSDADAAKRVRDEKAGAAIIIPAGLTDAVTSGKPAEIRVLSGPFAVSTEVARSVVSRYATDVGAVQLLVATTVAGGGSPDGATIGKAQAAVQAAPPIAIVDEATQKLQASLATFYGAAMAIMFVFFATQYGALAILSDRQAGTLPRLLAAPIRPAAIVLGASLGAFALGLVSMTTLVVATTLIRHAQWGPPLLVALLVVCAVVAAMGISMAVASIGRTPQQAGTLNAIVAMSLSVVGGVFIPLSQAPEALVQVSLITPHAWFLRGIDNLAGTDPSLAAIAPSIAALLLIGVVTGAIGLARARRALVPA